ncbi:MAG: DUF4386 domain-containing protein [Spirochaetia bacterium]|nr:DUF4386 domain-containing protein [Spirochaetia bacterium]
MNETSSKIKAAKIAGFMYLLIIISNLLSMAIFGSKLDTIKDVINNETYFRIDTAYSLAMYLCVIVLAVYLYAIVKNINENLALLALSFRVGEAILGVLGVIFNLLALQILNGQGHAEIFGAAQMQTLAQVFQDAYWLVAMVIFSFLGLGSVIYFYLFFQTNYIPKALSVLGMISYALVFTGSFISIIFSNNAYMFLGSQAILFEIVIGAWLLFKGIKTD